MYFLYDALTLPISYIECYTKLEFAKYASLVQKPLEINSSLGHILHRKKAVTCPFCRSTGIPADPGGCNSDRRKGEGVE